MGKRVQCELCPNSCILDLNQTSRCRARINRDGKLYSLVYGKPCAVHVDPIEKKPFFHFLPGHFLFSIATAGCVLSCKFCQNWQISQARPEDTDTYDLPPDRVVGNAIAYKCRSIAYTYTEPTAFTNTCMTPQSLHGSKRVRNAVHSCGYIKEKPLGS